MERATVRLTSRCDGGQRSQLHHCVAFCERCTMMRSNRTSAAATARESHASHIPCKHQFLVSARRARIVRFASRCGRGRAIAQRFGNAAQ
eukprot:11165131-Lingulodinium_polyedra.AAC.1